MPTDEPGDPGVPNGSQHQGSGSLPDGQERHDPYVLGREMGEVLRRGDEIVFPEAAGAEDQWQRVVMNQTIDRYITALEPSTRTAVEISGSAHAGRQWKEFRSLNFPEFDLCGEVPEGVKADVVICEQVLEHVENPWVGASNLRRLCQSGGYVIVNTPFLIKVHELPQYLMRDYWRFTPRGLRVLLEGAGLVVEEVGAWGNELCVIGNLNRWSAYRPWHSLENQEDMPVVVWAFARNLADETT